MAAPALLALKAGFILNANFTNYARVIHSKSCAYRRQKAGFRRRTPSHCVHSLFPSIHLFLIFVHT